jgi:uncharacterized damage-inducible protein DinB
MSDMKEDLRTMLQLQRDALLWKLDGLSERQARMPMTPTGSNILGIVKHVASTEAGYLGAVFGRPFPEPMGWMEESAQQGNNADMWATAEQTIEWVAGFYRRIWAHSDQTIAQLPLDAKGYVPWWGPERGHVTLGMILTHVIAETARHTGHADILREEIDGDTGYYPPPMPRALPGQDQDWWDAYLARLKALAESFPE